MKTIRHPFSSVMFCAFLFIAIWVGDVAFADGMKPFEARVTRVSGAVRYWARGTNLIELRAGCQIQAGAIFQTSENGFVYLTFDSVRRQPDQTALKSMLRPEIGSPIHPQPEATLPRKAKMRLFPESIVRIVGMSKQEQWQGNRLVESNTVREVHLDLRAGRMLVDFPKPVVPGTNEIIFPGGKLLTSASVTMFDTNGAVYVLEGSVLVSGPGTNAVQTVTAGNARYITGEISPIPPEASIPIGGLSPSNE